VSQSCHAGMHRGYSATSYDPNKSFGLAVRHLFRHIRDGSTLRTNPLVRERFHEATDMEPDSVLAADVAAHIKAEAEICRSGDVASGRAESGERLYAIVCAIISGETPLRTASQLGLSRRQYYRDRRAACVRIACTFILPSSKNAQVQRSEQPGYVSVFPWN